MGQLRITSPWAQLGLFLGLAGGCFMLSSLGMFIVLTMKGISVNNMGSIDWARQGLLSTMKWLQALSSLFLFFLPALLFAFFTFTSRPLFHLGLRSPGRMRMYGLAVLAVLMAFPFVIWLSQVNQSIPLQDWMTRMEKDAMRQLEAFLKVNSTMDVVINVIVIALLPALCEELFFRGALQRILIHCFRSPWAGIIVTSILFSALHLQFQGFLPRMFLGVVLGVLYWYSGSLWTSIVAHFVNNAVQVIAVSFAPQYVTKNPTIPVFYAIASGIVVFLLLYFYRKMSDASFSRVYEDDRRDPFA